jgi:hypothetical protein
MKTYFSIVLLTTLGVASTQAKKANANGNGNAELAVNEICKRSWNANAGGGDGKYQDNINDYKCGTGLVCLVEEGDFGQSGEVEGICTAETCGGLKDTDDTESTNEETIRVTICHRTCSEKNPWVRITIDDDAWNGTSASGCGHEQQHDIREECSNKSLHGKHGVRTIKIISSSGMVPEIM